MSRVNGAVAGRFLVVRQRHGEVARDEACGETERTRRLDHQQGEVAATAVAEAQRLERLLDALGFPPPVEKALVDALAEADKQFQRADRAAGVQELPGPASDLVIRIGMMALDAVGEVRHLLGAVADGKTSGSLRESESGRVGRRMFEADDALEAEFRRAAVKARDRHVVAEGVLGEVQAAGLGLISRLASMTF